MNRKLTLFVVIMLMVAVFGIAFSCAASAERSALIAGIGADSGSAKLLPCANTAAADTVYITKTGSKFHAKGCSSLRRSCFPIARKEAIKKGYTACKRCSP